jgi:ribonuclease III
MMYHPNIKLVEAKQAIAIPDFKHDKLLRLALTDLSTLQLPDFSESDRQAIVLEYRRLAFLGDRLLDAVVADYLFATYPELTNKDLDDWRQKITCRESLTGFAIELGLPDFYSSWNRPDRRTPQDDPGVYGEMFEALVAVIYLDSDRSFARVYEWLCDRFIGRVAAYYEEDTDLGEDFDGTLSTGEYLVIGLEDFVEDSWEPGDDDDDD